MTAGSHYATPPRSVTHADLAQLLAADLAPLAGLEIGVSTSSFQTEGGLDGPGEPATNWRAWVAAGRAEPIGAACDLWRRFPDLTQRLRAMHVRVFRMSLEWARLAPGGDRISARAIERYADRITRLANSGIEPVITLQHFTHPEWLGADFWLDDRAPQMFAHYAREAVGQLGDALVRRNVPPPTRLLTINEPNMLAIATYIAGVFPHVSRALSDGDPLGAARAFRALDHMMSAHVRAYRAVHDLYADRHWPRPDVSWNVCVLDVYGLSRMLFDLLRTSERNVAISGIGEFIRRGRDEFYTGLCGAEDSPRVRTAKALERLFSQLVAPDTFEATLRSLYDGRNGKAIDSLAIDVYDPWSQQQARGAERLFALLASGAPWAQVLPEFERGMRLAEPWEWTYEPDVLQRCIRAVHCAEAPLPIDVIENGMSQRRDPNGNFVERDDGIRRPEFLRGYSYALARARAIDKLPVRAWCYWTAIDNYELGRYAPRFGLFALPDPKGPRSAGEWSRRDVAGDDSAETLARFATAITTGATDVPQMRAELAALWGATNK